MRDDAVPHETPGSIQIFLSTGIAQSWLGNTHVQDGRRIFECQNAEILSKTTW
jgi:hypothetical protein